MCVNPKISDFRKIPSIFREMLEIPSPGQYRFPESATNYVLRKISEILFLAKSSFQVNPGNPFSREMPGISLPGKFWKPVSR